MPAVINEIQEKRETIDVSEQTSEENVVPDATSQIEPIASAVTTQDENVCKEVKLVSGMFYFYGDHLGSSSVVTDSEGKVVQTTDYYPYGGVRHEFTDESFENDFLYTGKELDEELGIYYYGARYYMADVGRWMGQDPMAVFATERFLNDPQSLNLYSYARNNPLNYFDPNGASSVSAFWAGFSPHVGNIIGIFGVTAAAGVLAAASPAIAMGLGAVGVGALAVGTGALIYNGAISAYNLATTRPDVGGAFQELGASYSAMSSDQKANLLGNVAGMTAEYGAAVGGAVAGGKMGTGIMSMRMGGGVVIYGNQELPVYRGGNTFDISGLRLDKNGNITSGFSLNTNPNDPRIVNNGGAYTLDHLPAGLKIVPATNPKSTHCEIMPIDGNMSKNQYIDLVNQIKLTPAKE